MVYTTNQKDIVECARQYYIDYPTIVNNIPKESNYYNNTMYDFARIDNKLASSQMAIGGSSNLAQICLSYTYNNIDEKYEDYVSILSVLAQCAIDNAKRTFDIDLNNEIRRIKNEMNIKTNGYPIFWKPIKEYNDNRYSKKSKTTQKKKDTFYNPQLTCPMNYLYLEKIDARIPRTKNYPISKFFIDYPLDMSRRKSKAIEELIEKYSWNLYQNRVNTNDIESDNSILLRDDFEKMIEDIRGVNISKNYLGLMSWLIDRTFRVSPNIRSTNNIIQSKLNKNRPLLIKTLYSVSPEQFLKCFSKNINNEVVKSE